MPFTFRFAVLLISLLLCPVLCPENGHTRTTVETDVSLQIDSLPQVIGNARRQEAWFQSKFGLKWRPESSARWRFEGLVHLEILALSPTATTARSQTLGSDRAGEWNKSGSPHFLEDQDFFLEHRYGYLRVSVGSKTLRWGISDFFDPLDQINSRRMERPLQAVKRGEWMLHTDWQHPHTMGGTLAIETFVIPSKRGAILPSETSPWLPRELYIPNLPDTEFVLPELLEYRFLGRDVQDAALSWNAGARIVWRPGENEIILQYDEG
ncbi:MAG: hypothetical protein RBT63_05815, partial [Bdellovibrionales bacterium]|nr:hypothetical protein [Bdellovibrionales bacterium]